MNVSTPANERARLMCNTCGRQTNHDVLTDVTQSVHDPILSTSVTYRTVQCRGCETLSAQILKTDAMSQATDPETGEVVQIYDIDYFPPRQAGRKALQHAYELPQNIGFVYKEVLSALFGNMRMLAAVGLRTLVEAICNDQRAAGKSLVEKINQLRDTKVLTPAGADILHRVRVLGNTAAHEAGPQPIKDLWEALDVVEHTLASVYILPARAQRKKRTKPPSDDVDF